MSQFKSSASGLEIGAEWDVLWGFVLYISPTRLDEGDVDSKAIISYLEQFWDVHLKLICLKSLKQSKKNIPNVTLCGTCQLGLHLPEGLA